MSEKKRNVRILYLANGAEVSAVLSVEPTVSMKKQEGNYLLLIGGGAMEITLPDQIFEEIRGH